MSRRGDITGDGKLGRADLELLKQLVKQYQGNPAAVDALTPAQFAMLDVNADGQLDQDDVEALCKLLMNGNTGQMQALNQKFREMRGR